MDSHEDPATAAIRESHEEAGVDSARVEIKDIYIDDHGTWSYSTVIAHTYGVRYRRQRGIHGADADASTARNFPVAQPVLDRVRRSPLAWRQQVCVSGPATGTFHAADRRSPA